MQTEINKDSQDRLEIVYKRAIYISLINETLCSARLYGFTYHPCFDEIHLILLVDVEHLVPITSKASSGLGGVSCSGEITMAVFYAAESLECRVNHRSSR